MCEQTLKNSLKAPGLKQIRLEQEKQLRTIAINTLAFRKALEELRELNQAITKAEVQDDLLIFQAMANIGFPV